MKLKTKLILASAFLLTQTINATPLECGTYLEGNIGSNYSSFNFLGIKKSGFSSVGVNTNLGYLLNRYFAGEAGYSYYGSTAVNAFDVAAKAILPINICNNNFTIFGKLGAEYFFKGSNSKVAPFLGLGGSYALTRNLDFTVQAQGATFGYANIGLLTAGLSYYFG